jgi:hypothetical protein
VVLEHVAQGACLIVVPRPVAHPHVLGYADLHVVNVGAVPYWLEERVGEAEKQDVLGCIFAQVVVYPVDLAFSEDVVESAVETPCRRQVVPEGLLHDDAPPASALGGHTGRPQLLDDENVDVRRGRQVVHPVGMPSLQLLQRDPQPLVVAGLGEIPPHVIQVRGESFPCGLLEGRRGEPLHTFADHAAELFVVVGAAREPDDATACGETPLAVQIEQRRHQLSARQVTRSAEDDYSRGLGERGWVLHRSSSCLGAAERALSQARTRAAR